MCVCVFRRWISWKLELKSWPLIRVTEVKSLLRWSLFRVPFNCPHSIYYSVRRLNLPAGYKLFTFFAQCEDRSGPNISNSNSCCCEYKNRTVWRQQWTITAIFIILHKHYTICCGLSNCVWNEYGSVDKRGPSCYLLMGKPGIRYFILQLLLEVPSSRAQQERNRIHNKLRIFFWYVCKVRVFWSDRSLRCIEIRPVSLLCSVFWMHKRLLYQLRQLGAWRQIVVSKVVGANRTARLSKPKTFT